MARLYRSAASLRILGDDLDPKEITKLIGKAPSRAMKKGDQFLVREGHSIASNTGVWSIHADEKMPGDLNIQISEILEGTTHEINVWLELSRRFKVEFFCGLFLENGNEGLEISSDTMKILGSRGIALDFDIYGVDLD